jgi:hypothetical protein
MLLDVLYRVVFRLVSIYGTVYCCYELYQDIIDAYLYVCRQTSKLIILLIPSKSYSIRCSFLAILDALW